MGRSRVKIGPAPQHWSQFKLVSDPDICAYAKKGRTYTVASATAMTCTLLENFPYDTNT